jgi:phosphoglycerate kinase
MILWNGPLGAYEFVPFNKGTKMVAEAVAEADAESLVGGGDIVAALEELGISDKITHISTGGGAVLDFWEGKELPGLAVLREQSG